MMLESRDGLGRYRLSTASDNHLSENDVLLLNAMLISEKMVARYSERELMAIAQGFYDESDPAPRVLATLIFGELAANSFLALYILRDVVSQDPHPVVQNGLGMAFDIFCERVGYETALPEIADWLADPRPSVRLAVINGLRCWVDRPYFASNPLDAIEMLGWLREDLNDEVRHAAAEALREVGSRFPRQVITELNHWDLRHPSAADTFAHILGGRAN